MSLGIFSSSMTSRKQLKFEIKPETDYIVLRGNPSETLDFTFNGRIAVTCTEPLSFRSIKVTLEGKRKTSHALKTADDRILAPQLPSHVVNKRTFLTINKTIVPDQKTITVSAGTHDFPFALNLKGDIPETVEGMEDNWVIYSLKAVLDRGVMSKDMVAKRLVRVIRTLGLDRTESLRTQECTGEWPNKIKYQIALASRSVIFGSTIYTDFELTPLLEKLRVGMIHLRLEEQRKIRTVPGPDYEIEGERQDMWIDSTILKRQDYSVPDEYEATDEELLLPMKKFRLAFPLPRMLYLCRQSVEEDDWIRITHTMHYDIELLNPDGHTSELKAHLSLKIYISPNLSVGRTSELGTNLTPPAPEVDWNGEMQAAPPLYGSHRLDSLYEDINHSGYATPAHHSGAATPRFSRQGSIDDLAALSPAAGMPLPENLRARLANLQHHDTTDHHADGTGTEHPAEGGLVFNMDDLERVPTYTTAVRTQVMTPVTEAPPSYDIATSRDPSPTSSIHGGRSR